MKKYTLKKLKKLYVSCQAMWALSWVALALAGYLVVTLLYNHFVPLLVRQYVTRAFGFIWLGFGWALVALLVVLVLAVLVFSRLYPSFGAYLASARVTWREKTDFLSEGLATKSEDDEITVKKTLVLEGFIAYQGRSVLVVLFAPTGIGGKSALESAQADVHDYADSLLPGFVSGGVQHVPGASYWTYTRKGAKSKVEAPEY